MMRIHLYVNKGHFRDSLLALLRTIPNTFVECPRWDRIDSGSFNHRDPDLIIVDVDRVDHERLRRMRSIDPTVRLIGLVDRDWSSEPNLLVDDVIQKSISAGEFLDFIRSSRSGEDHTVMKTDLLVEQR